MYLLPLSISFFSFFVAISMGRLIGKGVLYIAISCLFLCVLSSIYIFYEVCLNGVTCYIYIFNWLCLDTVDIHWGFVFDQLSVSMIIIINVISLCAHVYSAEYMFGDLHITRFFSYLSLFTFFMLLLVLSDNILQLFVGWEGVGICSYLLINFWFTRVQANKAAILAVMVNKLGDIALLCGCVILQSVYKSMALATVAASTNCLYNVSSTVYVASEHVSYVSLNMLYDNVLSMCYSNAYLSMLMYQTNTMFFFESIYEYSGVVCAFLMLAAVGKSAQSGLHMWLPEAMEGPTPVSSLIHAATMVTAGVFLLLRFSYLFDTVNTLFILLLTIGSITAFFASTIGLLQTDIKKVVAYSTCSQLGYMFVCIGLSSYNNSIFHLFNHAFFKALLFLTAGYVIHAISNEQDIRKMGSILKLLPFSYMMLLIGSLSIIGFPFLSGFYSKDKIIELCFNTYSGSFYMLHSYKYIIFAQTLCVLAVILTSIYSTKIFFYIFLNSFSGFRNYILKIHFSSHYIFFPLIFLSICSISSGYVTSDMMIGIGSDFWCSSFNVDSFFMPVLTSDASYKLSYALHTEFNHYIRQITLFWTFYFACISIVLLLCFKEFLLHCVVVSVIWLTQLGHLLRRKYLFINRSVLMYFFTSFFYLSYNMFYRVIDKGIIEFVGPFGIVHMLINVVNVNKKLQTGMIYHYAGYMLLFMFIVVYLTYDVVY